MAELTVTISCGFRHRWLGLAFIGLCAIPADLFGLTYSDRASERIARIGFDLMGPKITVA